MSGGTRSWETLDEQSAGGSAVCSECSEIRNDGWSTSWGHYFCAACWRRYKRDNLSDAETKQPVVPEPPKPSADWSRPSRQRSRWNAASAEEEGESEGPTRCRQPWFCGRRDFRLGFGRSCGCADQGKRSSSAGAWKRSWYDRAQWWTDERTYGNNGTQQFCAPELRGVGFCDAHCHLDYLVQNERFGGLGWNSKQEICRYWADGEECTYGDYCDYAHGEHEVQQRTPIWIEDLAGFKKRHAISESSEKSIKRLASSSGLRFLITNCSEVQSIPDTLFLASISERELGNTVFCTFGCHPHNYRVYNDEVEASFLKAFAECGHRAVAWGECGLDYYKNSWDSKRAASRKQMIDVFARQAMLAVERNLPLVVHTRDAEEDTLSVLRLLPRDHKVHIHAFQNSVEMMHEVLRMLPNSVIGVSGMILLDFPGNSSLEIARQCPLSRMVLETDAPFLSTEPAGIPEVAVKVAQLKGIEPRDVLMAANSNCEHFYGIAAAWLAASSSSDVRLAGRSHVLMRSGHTVYRTISGVPPGSEDAPVTTC
eukprot:TRINITY_DN35224_c0_g1_i1.p1 TRINITY_DN35224_c0_g1~~TRINITY_DN35224_c0_g1_i1.p1  ORF type:complete len:539 (-),score=53.98 TRINITY_DN35224_c0_g1_i1:352-1968(-)